MLAIISVALLLTGCTLGSRNVVTQSRTVSGFDRVAFAGLGELTMVQGNRESLVIEAESNVMGRIVTEVRDGTLHIELKGGPFGWGVTPTRAIRYTLTVRELNALDISGVGSVLAEAIETDRLELSVSGTGKLVIRALSADDLVVEHSGVGQCELAGQAREQTVSLTGAGAYDAGDLEGQDIELQVSGVGKATVWATDTLDVQISGAGSVEYYGAPAVTQDITGVGRVRGLGEHRQEV